MRSLRGRLLHARQTGVDALDRGVRFVDVHKGRFGYNGIVMRKLQAVYEGGVLRPTEQLPLEEHQLVSVIVLDADTDDEEVEFEPPHCFEALANHSVSRETVRAALSKIPGSLDADFAAERNER